MTKQGIKIISYCLLFFGILYFVITTWLNVRRINQSNNEELASSDSLSSEYLNLISKENQMKIKIAQVYLSKIRNPLARLYFEDSDILFINKICSIKDIALAEKVQSEIKSATMSKEIVYNTLTNGSYRFSYETRGVDPVSNIHLTFYGDSLTTVISNDSILSYHLLCKNSSFSYNENSSVDMILEGNQNFYGITPVPADILFMKRNNALYVLLLIPKSGTIIKPGLLYDIVNSKNR